MPQHFLFVAIGGGGHVFPTLGLVGELTARGHRVTYVTTEDFAGSVQAVGARFAPYKSVFEDITLPEVVSHEDSETFSRMLFLDENLAMLRACEEHLAGDRPDVVAYEIFPTIAGRLLAAKWGRPALCFVGGPCSNEHYNLWQELVDTQGHRPWADNETFRTAMEELMAEYGLGGSVADIFREPEAYTVASIPRSYQPRGETFDERFNFVGPIFSGKRLGGDWQPPADGRPVLLVSLGDDFNDQPDFFRTCARSFAGTRWHVVMATGRTDLAELGELPENVEAHPWISFLEVLPHATAFLMQGSVGATMDAMYHGVPLLIFSEFAAEAGPTARRALELGLGHEMTREAFDAGQLPDLVERLVADPGVRARVDRMRDDTRTAGGAVAAADGIEAYLRRVAG